MPAEGMHTALNSNPPPGTLSRKQCLLYFSSNAQLGFLASQFHPTGFQLQLEPIKNHS